MAIAEREWESLFDRLCDQEIINAIEDCKNLCAFPPSYSEFLAIGLSIPSFEMAKDGVANNDFCSMLYEMMGNTGMLTVKEIDIRFRECYKSLREKFLLGIIKTDRMACPSCKQLVGKQPFCSKCGNRLIK